LCFADVPFGNFEAVLSLAPHLHGSVAQELREKEHQYTIDTFSGGCDPQVAIERASFARSNGAMSIAARNHIGVPEAALLPGGGGEQAMPFSTEQLQLLQSTNQELVNYGSNATNTTIIHPQHIQEQIGHVSYDRRDLMLVTLEKYLLQNLRASDVVTGEDGVLLFNVNQVSYIVEGSVTKAEQKDSKKKIKDTTALMSMRTCVRTGNCKSFVLCIGQTDIDSMWFFFTPVGQIRGVFPHPGQTDIDSMWFFFCCESLV
jgi:hypothetical protein